MNKSIKRYLKCGPGGRRCVCCFPAPGSRERKFEYRRAKRKARQQALRDQEQ